MKSERSRLIKQLADDVMAIKRAMTATRAYAMPKDIPSRSQLSILFLLQQDGPLHLKEIAARLHMTSSAATQLIDGLVNDAILARTEDVRDRRKIHLALTTSGRRILARATIHHLKIFDVMLTPLHVTELAALHRLFQKIHLHQP